MDVQLKGKKALRDAVLVVEDDPLLLELLEELLSKSGRDVVTAAHGEEALEIIQDQPGIRAVITDLAMPEMDGVRLVQWLAKETPEMPVVVLTATSDSGVRSMLDERHLEAVIQKPLTGPRINELLGTLNSLHV